MTTKNGLHFKRNAGIETYTKDWGVINHIKDLLEKPAGLISEEGINIVVTAIKITRMKSWRCLPYKDKENFIDEMKYENPLLKKVVRDILLN
jgi:hypothetical protein